MGHLAISRNNGSSIRFVTDYDSAHFMNVGFLERLCFSGSFDTDTLTDCLAERRGRHYRTTSKVVRYEDYQKGIVGRSHVRLDLQMKDTLIIDGINAYLYLWDEVIKEHYMAYVERYTHHSRLYQIDTGFFCYQYPIDKKW